MGITRFHAADTVLVYHDYDGVVYGNTVTLVILERGSLTQADARKAIDSVMGVRSVVVNRNKVEIQMSRSTTIHSHEDARAVAADFAEMLAAAYMTRDRLIAKAQQAASRSDYRNDPPHRRR